MQDRRDVAEMVDGVLAAVTKPPSLGALQHGPLFLHGSDGEKSETKVLARPLPLPPVAESFGLLPSFRR